MTNYNQISDHDGEILVKTARKIVEEYLISNIKIKLDEKFDLVFVDPPFRQDLEQISCQKLEEFSLLSDNALIYLEI